jgi:hypothetical protein
VRRDHDELGELVRDVPVRAGVAEILEMSEIAAGAERITRAGYHDSSHRVVGGGAVDRCRQRVAQLWIDCVSALRTVEGQRQDAAARLLQELDRGGA